MQLNYPAGTAACQLKPKHRRGIVNMGAVKQVSDAENAKAPEENAG